MRTNYDDTYLKDKWQEFWEAQGISWSEAPSFPTKRNTIKKFKKLVKQQDQEQAYSRHFIDEFVSIL